MRRPWFLPLVPLYAAAVEWKRREFEAHPERVQRLEQPVVSIGSVSAGGAGKTPFVIALGSALRSAGYGIDILSRGYGRKGRETLRVLPSGSAEEFGDEPLLMAQRLLCPVYVARRRYDAGLWAERDRLHAREDKALSVHLLDDGFQHRQLARAVDIALLTAEDARDTLLPAGNLRESLRQLRRADIVVVREQERRTLRPVLERIFAQTRMPPVWTIRRRFGFVDRKPSKRPLAFCGIARPEGFRNSLSDALVEPVALVKLRDHQVYDEAVIRRLIADAAAAGADGFVTTGKDAVKLAPKLRSMLEDVAPFAVGDIRVTIDNAPQRIGELIGLIKAWRKRG